MITEHESTTFVSNDDAHVRVSWKAIGRMIMGGFHTSHAVPAVITSMAMQYGHLYRHQKKSLAESIALGVGIEGERFLRDIVAELDAIKAAGK